ncbi:protein-disulfide reductase DsbD family protein [Paracoccus sp. WLY502]|uniref:protein-disulfide reductase DsbD domain-containing protein n=1 Tax=Paracoccus yibinensis TaxID=3068891 RepID=UPI0027965406|nr:protein-disulfide reductase DsbD domain-containing protein [Paracoccus sp. WLY502]MDQ1901010.1 protein-disulfide reductase DsbD family protein [Paracoccus sp. WLY502]
MIRYLSFTCLFLSATALAAESPSPGLADARILPGWTLSDGSRIGAIEFRLHPGWKTYWRNPGDTGLPPTFDWSGSANLAGLTLHWPAPEAIPSGDGVALGYHDRLVLPFTARPADPGQPVDLAVSVDFGLCKDICVPAHVTLTAGPPAAAPDPAILSAMEAVPGPAPGQPDCTVKAIDDGMRVTATLPGPVTLAAIELADSDVWTSGTEMQVTPDKTTMVTDFVPPEAAPFDLSRDRLVFTVIDDDGAVEMRGCAG